jgi:hypothetical protein
MAAALWAPLFQRPEFVREALVGKHPTDLDSRLGNSAGCAAALLAERKRQGLVRRRTVQGGPPWEPLSLPRLPRNPYIVGPPITNPRDFYGREEDLSFILREVEEGSVALIGEMRMGKTSLLYQLEHHLSGGGHYLSLQQSEEDLEALPERMARRIAPGERHEGHGMDLLDRAISARLKERIQSHGPGARLTLLLDEAQFLVGSRKLRNMLRNLFQARQQDGLRVVVAGPPHKMRELAEDPTGSPFLNIFYPHRLKPMKRPELARLLRTPLGDGYTVTDEAVDRVAELSGGRPLIAQDLGKQALQACHAERRFRIEAEDIDAAFRGKVFDDVIDIYGYPGRWKHLPEEVQQVLLRLARLPAQEREGLDRKTLRLLAHHGLADTVQQRLDVEPPFLLWIHEEHS